MATGVVVIRKVVVVFGSVVVNREICVVGAVVVFVGVSVGVVGTVCFRRSRDCLIMCSCCLCRWFCKRRSSRRQCRLCGCRYGRKDRASVANPTVTLAAIGMRRLEH